MKLKKNDRLLYVPTDGPHKGKLCPATVVEIVGPDRVNLEVRTAKGDHFVESVAKVPVVTRKPKPGEAAFPK